jgi:hypothetical protein
VIPFTPLPMITFFFFFDFVVNTCFHIFNSNPFHFLSDPKEILNLPSATAASFVHKVQPPQTVDDHVALPEARKAEEIHTLTGVNEVREKLNLTGKGIKVGIIE